MTIWFMQHDERAKRYVGTQLKQRLQEVLGTKFEGTVESMSIFSPSITLARVRVYDRDNPGWSWGTQRFTLACSWWYLILYRSIDLWVTLEDFHAHSDIKENKPAIGVHMNKVFMGLADMGLPVDLKSIVFKRAQACFEDKEHQSQARFAWQSELKKIHGRLKTSGYLLDGSLRTYNHVVFESLKGSIHADIGVVDSDQTAVQADCSIELPYLPKNMRQTSIAGSWKGTRGTFSLKNVHEQVMIDPIQLSYDGTRSRCSIRGSIPLASIGRFIAHDAAAYNELTGSCSLMCDMRYEDGECAVTGRVSVDDCAHKKQTLGSGVVTFARQRGQWKGNLHANQDAWYGVKGTWQWDEGTETGSCKITNSETIQLPHCLRMHIKPGSFQSTVRMDAAKTLTGSYKAAINTLWNDTVLQCSGSLQGDAVHIASTGTIHKNPYECTVQLAPTLELASFAYRDPSGTSLLRVSTDVVDNAVTHAVVGLPFLRTLFEHTYNTCPLQVEGSLAASIKKKDDELDISVTTMDGLIRLPQTYNVMRDAKCGIHIDTSAHTIALHDLVCTFNEGGVAVNRAVVHYDDTQTVIFMHIPILVDALMLNMEQGLLAKISGYALLTKQKSNPMDVAANIIIDRAHVKENVLSGTFQKNVLKYTGSPFASYGADTTCDIQIASRMPIRIKTPFLETTARVNMSVKNTFKDPHVNGSIQLLSGLLAFPYRPLYITKGTIYFLPHQLHDPSIELVAKNKIKKYNVELQVGGSLENHQITLDAAPSLTEEQIVALLLVGSEEESLNVVMPALIMQNLQAVMFGYDQSPRAIDKVFKSLLQPFHGIHVVPSFSDQTGRGGLRGAIEIDVNDRWRGLIQKNFSLTEDTRLEVEYLVSDEISVRGVANERRDVGAEVEMRWKF